jgi:hypothetical protein
MIVAPTENDILTQPERSYELLVPSVGTHVAPGWTARCLFIHHSRAYWTTFHVHSLHLTAETRHPRVMHAIAAALLSGHELQPIRMLGFDRGPTFDKRSSILCCAFACTVFAWLGSKVESPFTQLMETNSPV